MKAWTVSSYGEPKDVMQLVEQDIPQAGPGDIRVRVLCAAIGLPDLFLCRGSYEFKPEFPFTPGQEVVGIVKDSNDHPLVENGQRVFGVTAFYSGHGGFAEHTILTGSSVMKAPEGMPDQEAAAFGIPFRTAWIALDERAKMQAGETLLVLGAAGGTGFAAIQLGKAMGARVIAVVSDEQKASVCRDFGADDIINRKTQDFVEQTMALTGQGADVIFDPVGGDTFRQAQNCLAYNGRLLAIGFASGAWGETDVRDLVLSNRSVLGVLAVAPNPETEQAMMQSLQNYYSAGKIRTAVDRLVPFEETASAVQTMADRGVQGKQVVFVSE